MGVHDAIVSSPTPRKALNWLRQGAGAPILRAMATGTTAVAHEALDAHARPGAANYVRHMLVANGALAARDDRLATLERIITDTVATIERPEDRKIVAAFATWHVLRRLRRQADHRPTARTPISHARNQVVGAVRLLDWLAEGGLSLATCTQGDIDRWLTTGPPSRYDARHFLEWTSERKLSATLEVPVLKSGPGSALDAEERWDTIRRLLTDPAIELADRVAGSFLLLYAQPRSRAAMTLDRITVADTGVSVRFASYDLAVSIRSGCSSWPRWRPAGPTTSASVPLRAPGSSPATSPADPSPPTISANALVRSGSTHERPDGQPATARRRGSRRRPGRDAGRRHSDRRGLGA